MELGAINLLGDEREGSSRLHCAFGDSWKRALYSSTSNSVHPCFILFIAFSVVATMIIPIVARIIQLLFFNKFGPHIIRYSFGSPFKVKSVGVISILKYYLIFIQTLLTLGLDVSISSLTDLRSTYILLSLTVLLAFVLPLHIIETTRSTVGADSLLGFWLLSSILYGVITLQDLFSPYKVFVPPQSVGNQGLIQTAEILLTINSAIILLCESLFYSPSIELKEYFDLNGWDITSVRDLFSRFTFVYLNKSLAYARENDEIDTTMLPSATIELDTEVAYNRFLKNWNQSVWKARLKTEKARLKSKKAKEVKPSLFYPMVQTTSGFLFRALIFDLMQDICNLAQPYLLRSFLQFITQRVISDKNDLEKPPVAYGIMIAIALYLLSVVKFIGFNRYQMNSTSVGYCVESFLSSHAYHKALRLSSKSRQFKSSGEIVNNLAQDVEELSEAPEIILNVINQPIKITAYLIALYSFLGPASLIGLACGLSFTPMVYFFFKYYEEELNLSFKFKDKRAKLTSEILNSIKSIKLYSWEKPMLERLDDIRNKKELVSIRNMGVWNSMIDFVWSSMPFIVSCGSFAATALIYDKTLTPEIIFPALTLFDVLTEPILELPDIFSRTAEVKVCIARLVEYFTLDEFENDIYEKSLKPAEIGEDSVTVKESTFVWEVKSESGTFDEEDIETSVDQTALKDINFTARKGTLTCVVGKVGSGKSTFLNAILGKVAVDLKRSPESVIQVKGSVAYCAQTAWITNSSVRENILFGRKYDKVFYKTVVEACELAKDFETLPDGDRTVVGEKGISLSGGQKARLSLARAVYSKSEIYILDDILSAVDAHVGRNIIEKVLGKHGILASKTVILATNSVAVLHEADNIILFEFGSITESGTFDQVMQNNNHLAGLIREFGRKEHSSDKSEKATPLERESNSSASSDEHLVEPFSPVDHSKLVRVPSRAASFVSFNHNYIDDYDDASIIHKTGLTNEIKNGGKVNIAVYLEFFKACGLWSIISYFVLDGCLVGSKVLDNYILKHWSELNSNIGHNTQVGFYLFAYTGVGVLGSLCTLVSAVIIWVYCCVNGGRYFHDKMAMSVLRSPMSFFETTPVGRILNRFTDDIGVLDQHLIWLFISFNFMLLDGISVFAIVVYNLPGMFFVLIFLLLFYDSYRRNYIPGSRELKRLKSAKKSPVFSHLQESITGIDTIAAFDQTKRFIFKNELFLNDVVLCQYNNLTSNCWLSMRLQNISALILFFSTILISVLASSEGSLTPGMVGFIMTYVLEVTYVLNSVVKDYANIETRAVTIERLVEYCNLTPEAEMVIDEKRPSADWPQHGSITFENYSTRYRENLDPVLNSISFEVQPSEKIGIVGRTGAGKSTLTLALFRILEASGGKIVIDGIDTSTIGLFDLRSKLNIIPQDSHIIDGTIRQNLDPFEKHTDDELWKVLEMSHLKDHVENMKSVIKLNDDSDEDEDEDDEDDEEEEDSENVQIVTGLEALVTEGGGNLSAGQRQLMCLARALLNPSKVLVLDEATASVDVETDKIVQETIRSEFKDKTILTIAHRIDTIMDSDKILVLDKGNVKEFASPRDLLKDKSTIFYSLCQQSGHLPPDIA